MHIPNSVIPKGIGKFYKNKLTRIQLILIAMVFSIAGVASYYTYTNVLVPRTAQAYHYGASCFDLWRHSGHTDNVRWYHCHNFNSNGSAWTARVHICGYSGWLHGITVSTSIYRDVIRYNHAHDYGGEGC